MPFIIMRRVDSAIEIGIQQPKLKLLGFTNSLVSMGGCNFSNIRMA